MLGGKLRATAKQIEVRFSLLEKREPRPLRPRHECLGIATFKRMEKPEAKLFWTLVRRDVVLDQFLDARSFDARACNGRERTVSAALEHRIDARTRHTSNHHLTSQWCITRWHEF